MSEPYYADESVTLWHGPVVNCHLWHSAARSDRPGIERASAARMCLSSAAGRLRVTCSRLSTSSKGRAGAQNTMLGRVTPYLRRVGAPARSASTVTWGHVLSVDRSVLSGTTETGTLRTTTRRTSPSCAGVATWLRTVV